MTRSKINLQHILLIKQLLYLGFESDVLMMYYEYIRVSHRSRDERHFFK